MDGTERLIGRVGAVCRRGKEEKSDGSKALMFEL